MNQINLMMLEMPVDNSLITGLTGFGLILYFLSSYFHLT